MSYSGDFESQEQEDYYHRQYLESQQTPDVVPCFGCGNPMYEFSDNPRLNICGECGKKMSVIEEKF